MDNLPIFIGCIAAIRRCRISPIKLVDVLQKHGDMTARCLSVSLFRHWGSGLVEAGVAVVEALGVLKATC